MRSSLLQYAVDDPIWDAMAELSNSSPRVLISWDFQTRLFMRYLLGNVEFGHEPFTVLDVGCGMGGGLAVMREHVRNIECFGIDLAEDHVRIAKAMYPGCASFNSGPLTSVQGRYDVIVISNVLEHVPGWEALLWEAFDRASQVLVAVPFREDLSQADTYFDHVVSFDRTSFQRFSGWMTEQRVTVMPYAWGAGVATQILGVIHARSFGRMKRQLIAIFTRPNSRGKLQLRHLMPSLLTTLGIAAGARKFRNQVLGRSCFASGSNENTQP